MHSPAVPKQQIASLTVHFHNLGATLFEPLDLLFIEGMPVIRDLPPSRILIFAMSLEVFREETLRALHDHKTTIFRAVLVQVDDALNARLAIEIGILINVRPALSRSLGRWLRQRHVDAVEGDEQLVRSPDFGECVENTGFPAL